MLVFVLVLVLMSSLVFGLMFSLVFGLVFGLMFVSRCSLNWTADRMGGAATTDWVESTSLR